MNPPCKDKRGADLISNALPFKRLWYGEPIAIGYAEDYSRSHDAVIRVYDDAGNLIETHEHTDDFKATINYQLGRPYRKPYTSAQCVRGAGDFSTLTMIK